jgi:hypothetical protein
MKKSNRFSILNKKHSGDFISSDTEYPLSKFRLINKGSNYVKSLHLETVKSQSSNNKIKVELDPDGPSGPAGYIAYDTVKIATLKVDLDGDYNRDGNPVDHKDEAAIITELKKLNVSIIKIPVLYTPDTPQQGSKTYLPNAVNICVVKLGEKLKLAVPKTFFDPFQWYIKTRCLNYLGLPGNDNTWNWIESSELHPAVGTVHCASNTEKQPPK